MEGRIVLALLVALPIQIAAWLAIEIDTRRRGTRSLGWSYGMLMPVVGLFVIPAYLYERRHVSGK